jgi:hypothetical protein
MFVFGMLEDGPRGMDYADVVQRVEQELHAHAHQEPPGNLNQVICDVDDSVIPQAFQELLEQHLDQVDGVDFSSRSMVVRRLIWQISLQTCCDVALELGFTFT